jgi:hypothetical protein
MSKGLIVQACEKNPAAERRQTDTDFAVQPVEGEGDQKCMFPNVSQQRNPIEKQRIVLSEKYDLYLKRQ